MKLLGKVLNFIIGTSMAVLAIVTIAQVFSRYFLNIPVPWATDIIRISFIYCLFFGSVIAVREKMHLNIDFVTIMLPSGVKKIVNMISNLFVLLFLTFLIIYGLKLSLGSFNQTMPYLTFITMPYLYAPIPISGLLMFIYMIVNFVEELQIKSEKN